MSSLRFTVSADASAAQVLACFGDSFGLDEKPEQTREEVFLDSFDWRLYEAGYLLCVTKTSRRKLSLLDRDSREEVKSAVLKGRGLPRMVCDFTDPGLAERLAPLLWVRAADPVATVRVTRQPIALLDDLQKTVVRGALESFSHEGANAPFLVLLTLSAGAAAMTRRLKRRAHWPTPIRQPMSPIRIFSPWRSTMPTAGPAITPPSSNLILTPR